MRAPPDPPPTIERHSRKCAICTHPNRQAIDDVFLHQSPNLATVTLSQKGERKANREPLRLETVVTPTKQTPALRSNREKEALSSIRGKTLEADKKSIRSTPNFVAIKTTRDPLFSMSYAGFLISPCSD
jgi:hypothetical protein